MAKSERVASSIKKIIDLSAAVSVLCRNYSTTVGSAITDIARLQSGVDNFNATFQTTYTLLDGQEPKEPGQLLDSLDGSIAVLDQTKNSLVASEHNNNQRHTLEWPYDSNEVSSILSDLEGHEQIITAALHTASIVCINLKERHDVLHWLSTVPCQSHHRRIQGSRISNTCDWLLQHETFREWEASDTSAVLRLTGIPGVGKTVATSKVIDYFQSTSTASATHQGFAFFYCSYQEEERREPVFVLRKYIHQLSAPGGNLNYMRRKLRDLHTRDRLMEVRLNLDSCKVQLLESVNLLRQTILVLDGIDECIPNAQREIMDTMEFLLLNSKRPLKVFISGGDEADTHHRFPFRHHIDMGARNNEKDLREFINAGISKLETAFEISSSSLHEDIVNTLVDQSHGMFLWASLKINDLLDSPTLLDLRFMLREDPGFSLHLYDSIYHRVRARNKQAQICAERAFMWVMCACAPLSSDELLSAIRLDPRRNNDFLSDAVTERQLLDLCSGLLRLDSQRKVWLFVHHSVMEYLETYLYSLQEAHCHIAKACLKLLIEADKNLKSSTATDSAGQPGGKSDDGESGRHNILNPAHPIQVYARHHWIVHLQALENHDADPELGTLLKSFLGSPMQSSLQYQQWCLQIDSDRRKSLPPTSIFHGVNVGEISPEDTPILAMCRFSLYDLLEDWWAEAEIVLSHTNRLGDNLLILAAEGGCRSICESLVQRGMDVNVKSGNAGSALTAAVVCGNTEVVEFLIEKGANVAASLQSLDSVNDQRALKQLALDYAAVAGDLNLVKFLISQGVDINHATKPDLKVPLHLAAELGGTDVVAALLDANADPTREDELSRTPLDFARRSGSDSTVLLLEKAIKIYGRVLVLGLCFKASNEETTLRSVTISRTMKDYALFDSILRKYQHNRRRGWRRYSLKGLQHVLPIKYQRYGNSTIITERCQPQGHLLTHGQNQLCSSIKLLPEQSKNENIWVEAFVQELSSRSDPEDSGFGLECIEGWVMKHITILAISCIAGAGLIGILWATVLDETADGFAITGCLIAAEALGVALMVFEAQIRQATR